MWNGSSHLPTPSSFVWLQPNSLTLVLLPVFSSPWQISQALTSPIFWSFQCIPDFTFTASNAVVLRASMRELPCHMPVLDGFVFVVFLFTSEEDSFSLHHFLTLKQKPHGQCYQVLLSAWAGTDLSLNYNCISFDLVLLFRNSFLRPLAFSSCRLAGWASSESLLLYSISPYLFHHKPWLQH